MTSSDSDYTAKRDLAAEEVKKGYFGDSTKYDILDVQYPNQIFSIGADWGARFVLESDAMGAMAEALEALKTRFETIDPTESEKHYLNYRIIPALTQFEAFKKSVEGGE